MKLGFTGTRHGMTEVQENKFYDLLANVDEFYHGSCAGADVRAAQLVRQMFWKDVNIVAMPGPDDDSWQTSSGVDDITLPTRSHFVRNRDIVERCDELYATPKEWVARPAWKGMMGGTWYTINYAIKKKKPVTIIWPDGSTEKVDHSCSKP